MTLGSRLVSWFLSLALTWPCCSRAQEPPAAPTPDPRQTMAAFVVQTSPYKEGRTAPDVDVRIDRCGLPLRVNLSLGGFGDAKWDDWTAVFTPSRIAQKEKNSAHYVALLTAKDLSDAPPIALDRLLTQSSPESGLASRADIQSAPAFLQGVILRGVGANAGGALVLFDGAPLNDPWGSHPRWGEVPRHGLIRIESVPAGGATTWGEGAGRGVMQIFTAPPAGRRRMQMRRLPVVDQGNRADAARAQFRTQGDGASVGQPVSLAQGLTIGRHRVTTALFADDGTRNIDFLWEEPAETGIAQVSGASFDSDGHFPIAADHRGSIDGRSWSRSHRLSVRWRQPVLRSSELLGTVRVAEDQHNEGTPYRQSGSTGTFASLAMTDSPGGGMTWTGVAYVHRQRSHYRWGWADLSRNSETPVVDQFATPSLAIGALWGGAWWHEGDARTMAGTDVRLVRGELRENREFSGGLFRRARNAGGKQGVIGTYVSHNRALTPALRATLGARLDAWRNDNAFRRESSHDSARIFSDERLPDQSGLEVSAGAGLVWHATDDLHFRISGQHGFRRPSLQERFQDVGYHDRFIQADPFLRRERVVNLEANVSWRVRPRLELGATLFANHRYQALSLRDAAAQPASAGQLTGETAAYTVWTRINVDRIDGEGASFSGKWALSSRVSLEAAFSWNSNAIAKFPSNPELEGKTPPQVARHVGIMAAVWRPRENLDFRVNVRAMGRQYVDTENRRSLAPVTVADCSMNLRISWRIQLMLTAENLGNTRVTTDETSSGILYSGAPRRISTGIRIEWP